MHEDRSARLARMSSFELYLRTGQRQFGAAAEIELKFNPWHDPDDGRFTYAQNGGRGTRQSSGSWTGGSFTGGGGGRGGGAGASATWGRGGFTGGGGGGFGGAGATSTEKWGDETIPAARSRTATSRSIASQPKTDRLPARLVPSGDTSVIVKNGYSFRVDAQGRTREVKGRITLGSSDTRSRIAQAKAGGTDRLPKDDGGHYIALRFNGPRDAFNHFAQDRNRNRGQYRVLEKTWAEAVAKGHRVFVAIGPAYVGRSKRPAGLYVSYTDNGNMTLKYIDNPRGS